jgi:hypothetical protein
MADYKGEFVYRAMEEEKGLPKLGSRASVLGIRLGKDIIADGMGMVHRPGFAPGAANGLSCSPSIHDLPFSMLPVKLGGRHRKTVAWRIRISDLSSDLVAGEDSTPGRPPHVSIGPARTMSSIDYQNAVEGTRSNWEKA